jgi:hypothetical protein
MTKERLLTTFSSNQKRKNTKKINKNQPLEKSEKAILL